MIGVGAQILEHFLDELAQHRKAFTGDPRSEPKRVFALGDAVGEALEGGFKEVQRLQNADLRGMRYPRHEANLRPADF